MTTAEMYYASLDLAWPMSIVLSAELDVCPPPDLVEARWREFSARRIRTRLMPTSDLRIVDAGSTRVDFAAFELPRASWKDAIAGEADVATGLERVTGLRYLVSPDEGRSLVSLTGHHSVVDGRGGLRELQAFLRFLDDRDVPVQDAISLPATGRSEYPWQTDRRALLDLLRDLGDRNRELGTPLPSAWPPASHERVSRLTPINLSAATSTTALERARDEGVRIFPAMAAAWLGAVVATLSSTDEGVVQLNVPTDRSTPSDDPRRPTVMAVGVLAHRYRVRTGNEWHLARDVAATVTRALERGEGELFFHLTRLERISDLTTGAAIVETAVANAPPAASVTNIGPLDASHDPPWVRGMWVNLPATPNQVISVRTVGYRGRLCSTLWTDDLRVTPAQASALASRFASGFTSGFADALA